MSIKIELNNITTKKEADRIDLEEVKFTKSSKEIESLDISKSKKKSLELDINNTKVIKFGSSINIDSVKEVKDS
jgi:hypothetical protein